MPPHGTSPFSMVHAGLLRHSALPPLQAPFTPPSPPSSFRIPDSGSAPPSLLRRLSHAEQLLPIWVLFDAYTAQPADRISRIRPVRPVSRCFSAKPTRPRATLSLDLSDRQSRVMPRAFRGMQGVTCLPMPHKPPYPQAEDGIGSQERQHPESDEPGKGVPRQA